MVRDGAFLHKLQFLWLGLLLQNEFIVSCPRGFYGEECSRTCNCLIEQGDENSGRCDVTTGICNARLCQAPWYGLRCDITRCPFGTWGPKCRRFCNCRHNQACHSENGDCRGYCVSSLWSGISCNETGCNPGYYGILCKNKCQCGDQYPGESPITCHLNTGQCPKDLYVLPPPSCLKLNMYGTNCAFTPCKPKGCIKCDQYTGTYCLKCGPGYREIPTDGECIPCPTGLYGEKCSSACPKACGTSCTLEEGHCPACLTKGMYGRECNLQCKVSNCESCEKHFGEHCNFCRPGFYVFQSKCEACRRGTWGINCANKCPDPCRLTCQAWDGECKSCESGTFHGADCNIPCQLPGCTVCERWTGKYCLQCSPGQRVVRHILCHKCIPGTYGLNCSSKCRAECPKTCFPINGECPLVGGGSQWIWFWVLAAVSFTSLIVILLVSFCALRKISQGGKMKKSRSRLRKKKKTKKTASKQKGKSSFWSESPGSLSNSEETQKQSIFSFFKNHKSTATTGLGSDAESSVDLGSVVSFSSVYTDKYRSVSKFN